MNIYDGPCLCKEFLLVNRVSICCYSEGDLYPCHQFVGESMFKMGDVVTGVKNDIMRKEFQANILNKADCVDCWAKLYCSGVAMQILTTQK